MACRHLGGLLALAGRLVARVQLHRRAAHLRLHKAGRRLRGDSGGGERGGERAVRAAAGMAAGMAAARAAAIVEAAVAAASDANNAGQREVAVGGRAPQSRRSPSRSSPSWRPRGSRRPPHWLAGPPWGDSARWRWRRAASRPSTNRRPLLLGCFGGAPMFFFLRGFPFPLGGLFKFLF